MRHIDTHVRVRRDARRRQPARVREFRRLAKRLHDLEREHDAVLKARNALLLADQAAGDPSSVKALAAACGLDGGTIRVTMKRMRDRVTAGVSAVAKVGFATPAQPRVFVVTEDQKCDVETTRYPVIMDVVASPASKLDGTRQARRSAKRHAACRAPKWSHELRP
jgi:hypothetical protein